jgi:hypothetical protein
VGDKLLSRFLGEVSIALLQTKIFRYARKKGKNKTKHVSQIALSSKMKQNTKHFFF